MARAFARKFYKSKAWQEARVVVLDRDNYVCTRCGSPAEEVHHIEWLTPDNIKKWEVALNPDMLASLCKTCHIAIHRHKTVTQEGLKFNENGELVPI